MKPYCLFLMFFILLTHFQNRVPNFDGTSSNFAKKMQLSGTLPTLFAQPFSSIIKCIAKKPSAIDSDSLKPISVSQSKLKF